ncbi:MAG: YidC/Oxa1 family membrane protein insertase [Acutalibacteraceae bacterium]|jgi:YidC/Oxa1 family membrane protein insertase
MSQIFDVIAIPLGYVLRFIYSLIPNYFVTIFLFTLIIRAAMFPLSLKSQKATAERAKLAPRIERLQKKYGQDRQKLQQKQQELYQKNNVSMTGGCLPMLVSMIVLFGVISAIYKPLTYLHPLPTEVVEASVAAVTTEDKKADPDKYTKAELAGYYGEMRMLNKLDENEADIKKAIAGKGFDADKYFGEMKDLKDNQFKLFGISMLNNPWNDDGFKGINWLWLIPLLSGLTAVASALISMHFTNMAQGTKQPGQGCTSGVMIAFMPLFSVYIAFIVPAGVGFYWICSNVIACVQTVILNNIYNPAKIRAEAEAEYAERRRQKAEDKKRLAEARRKEQSEQAKALNEQQKSGKKPPEKPKKETAPAGEEAGRTPDGVPEEAAQTDENTQA